MPVDKKTLAPPGFTPKAPQASGGYAALHPSRYSWRSGVADMVRKTYERFGWDRLHINTYWRHPPFDNVPAGQPTRDFTSFDVWGPAGRGDPLDPALHDRVFAFLFEYPRLPNIEWVITKGRMWGYLGGWTSSPSGPPDSDPQHRQHIHVTYRVDGAGDLPKDEGGDVPADKVLFGVDVAGYQSGIDMKRVASEGYSFAVCKATEGPAHDGWKYSNPEYRRQIEGAKAAGLIPGSYHFLLEGPAKPQVDHFLKAAGDLSGQLIMVDFEDYPTYPSYTPTNRALREFAKELKARIGDRPLLVYSGQGFWNSGDPSGPLAQYGSNLVAWDAYYPDNRPEYASALYESVKGYGWGKRWGGVEPRIWQIGSRVKCAGFELDGNVTKLSREELLALTGEKPEPPKPPPLTLEQRVSALERWREETEAKA